MLIITRKKNESIVIGDGTAEAGTAGAAGAGGLGTIKITVIETGDGRVKIGVDAPRDVRVIRAEAADMLDFNRSAKTSRLPSGILEKLKSQSGMINEL
jgi:sRNA-binding carbon storage regulator CsrA